MKAFFVLLLGLLAKSTEAAQCGCATTSVGLHVRSGPGTSHSILTTLNMGECLPYKGDSQAGGSYTWYHLDYHGQSAWAASDWMTIRTCDTQPVGGGGRTDCYGNIHNLHPTGKASGGVAASQSDVHYRINEINQYKDCVLRVGKELCLQPSVIAGIISRETQGGALLDANGYGRYDPNGYGLMQCDIHTSGINCLAAAPKSCEHIEMMSRFLIGKIQQVQNLRSSWTKDQQLQGGIAAYNHFPPTSFSSVDASTTGHDYSNDVLARALYLESHYGY